MDNSKKRKYYESMLFINPILFNLGSNMGNKLFFYLFTDVHLCSM